MTISAVTPATIRKIIARSASTSVQALGDEYGIQFDKLTSFIEQYNEKGLGAFSLDVASNDIQKLIINLDEQEAFEALKRENVYFVSVQSMRKALAKRNIIYRTPTNFQNSVPLTKDIKTALKDRLINRNFESFARLAEELGVSVTSVRNHAKELKVESPARVNDGRAKAVKSKLLALLVEEGETFDRESIKKRYQAMTGKRPPVKFIRDFFERVEYSPETVAYTKSANNTYTLTSACEPKHDNSKHPKREKVINELSSYPNKTLKDISLELCVDLTVVRYYANKLKHNEIQAPIDSTYNRMLQHFHGHLRLTEVNQHKLTQGYHW